MNDGTPGFFENPKKSAKQKGQVDELVSFSVWEECKWIFSDKLLWLSVCLLPDKSAEKTELMVFLKDFLLRSIARRQKKN